MPTDRDLALDDTYDLAILGQDLAPLVQDNTAIVSDVEAAILMFAGEWFLDTSQGVDWFGAFSTKGSAAKLRAQIFQAIAARQGITHVLSVAVTVNARSRSMSIVWQAFADATLLSSTVTVSP